MEPRGESYGAFFMPERLEINLAAKKNQPKFTMEQVLKILKEGGGIVEYQPFVDTLSWDHLHPNPTYFGVEKIHKLFNQGRLRLNDSKKYLLIRTCLWNSDGATFALVRRAKTYAQLMETENKEEFQGWLTALTWCAIDKTVNIV